MSNKITAYGILLVAVGLVVIPACNAMPVFGLGSTHFTSLNMTSIPSGNMLMTAKIHLDQGIQQLKNGNSTGALMYLQIADQELARLSAGSGNQTSASAQSPSLYSPHR